MSKAERTKQYIVEQASKIINEKGIAGTSLDDVLKATKVAKGSIYTYFESKEGLAYACADYLLETVTSQRNKALEKQTTSKGKIHTILDLSKNPLLFAIDGGCPIVNLATESDDTNPVIRKKVKAVFQEFTQLYISILQDGIENGEFSNQLVPEEFAMKMFMALEGGNAICRAINSNKPIQTVIKSLKSDLEVFCLN